MAKQRLRWIWALLLLWARESLQELCTESEYCNCLDISLNEYELRCPKDVDSTFIVQVNLRDSASLKCNMKPSWKDFKLQSTGVTRDVENFLFEKCSLPELQLHDITERIGVQPTKSLRFESYLNLSSTLERRHLSGFPKLQSLSLASNGLTELPADLLMDLPELGMLNLRENGVRLPVEFLNAVPKLQTLELGRNKLTHMDPLLFQHLPRLTFLSLWGNQLTNLEPHTFDRLTALNLLTLNNNQLRTLPPDIFKPLKNLTKLNIASNYFSSLPEGLFSENVNLKTLSFSFNHGTLNTLPRKFLSNLTGIEDINLNNNNLTDLPEDILWGSSSLKNLTLRGNALTTLPKRIFKDLINLDKLDLSSNELTSLPDAIFEELRKLDKLELQRNKFSTIATRLFLGLVNLKKLNLEYNGLRTIEAGSFNSLGSLQVAQLSHNQITLENDSLGDTSPFSQCSKLEELNLAYNNISEIYQDWRLVLLKLQKLNLSYNQISSVSNWDFYFLRTDVVMDISHNNISEIQLAEAEAMAIPQELTEPTNVRILIDGNPVVCDCRVYKFLEYLEGRMHPAVQKLFHIIPGQLRCAGPHWMKDVSVTDLKCESLQCYSSTCPGKCECWYRPYTETFLANCAYRNLSRAPERIEDRGHRIELNLTGNLLTAMPNINQTGYGNITKLLLSHNNISSLSHFNISPALEILELDHNNLKRVDPMVLEQMKNSTSLRRLTLHANPWKCDCDASDFLNFIQANFRKIPTILNITCGTVKKPLSTMTVSDLCPVATGTIVGVSVAVAILGLLLGILAALYYRYQAEVKVWLYAHQMCLWFVTEEELDKDKLYDAFISYSHKDEDFVVNKLVPKLEEGPRPFKLCLHFRDWMAGEWIPTQIARSVEDSRRTVVVLSPNFLESVWGRMEFRAAHSQALSEGRARVIVVLYGDVGPTDNLDPELKAYLSMNTYVEWGDPWFWDKLRYALPHPPQVTKSTAKKIFETHQHHIQINGDKNGLIHPAGVPVTPPAITTPPADSLKTFTCNGSLQKGLLITDCVPNEKTTAYNAPSQKNDYTPAKNEEDNNASNRQCTPV